ncbi:hypothetical protein BpHYR1_049084 [Brachionus plicatilis]|uniref:Uncharacterized protein n=1 Tax=Brachionus plicatilis TaxID=10195 RepID=A0A3M7Q2Q9_BRAPC|nr:hypothetical protein BpHYR1_049084 [Brachionus plicatilis]
MEIVKSLTDFIFTSDRDPYITNINNCKIIPNKIQEGRLNIIDIGSSDIKPTFYGRKLKF